MALLWLAAGAALPRPAQADAPGVAAVSVVPADGRPRGIQLRAQAVDALVQQDTDGVWADTQVWVKLYNPGKQPVVVPVSLPGPQMGAAALPADVEVTLDNKPLAVQPLMAKADGALIGWTAPITVPVKGSAALRIRYRQALAEKDGLVAFTYPLTATLRWSGTPESLRVTVRFDPPAAAEQVLGYAPAAKRVDRDGLTWHWEYKRAAESVAVAFMAPAWWHEFAAAQAAAAAPGAGLAEHMALSRFYRQLAALPPPAFQGDADTYNRYSPAEAAALEAALAANEGAAPAERAAAHARLAELYRERAGRLGAGAGDGYLQMAAQELQAAVTLDSANGDLRTAAADLYTQLAQAAQARGDRVTADQHRARAVALETEGRAASEQALAQAAALSRAEQALEAGDLALARRTVAQALGPAVLTLPGNLPPAAAQAQVTVTTAPGRRTLALRLTGAPDEAAATAILQQAGQALAAPALAQVATVGNQLTVTLPYTGADQLAAAQARLAAALPAVPELALLKAALAPRHLAWEARENLLGTSERYVEHVDLEPAWQAWEATARRLEAAGRGEAAADGPRSRDPRLARLQAAFWAADAAAWRKLAAESRTEYRAEIGGEDASRRWELRAGAGRVLEATKEQVAPARAAAMIAAAALALVCLALAAWWGL